MADYRILRLSRSQPLRSSYAAAARASAARSSLRFWGYLVEFAASAQSGVRRPAQVAGNSQPFASFGDFLCNILLHGHGLFSRL
jgi:hypothetical protein